MTDPLTPDRTHMQGCLARDAADPIPVRHEEDVALLIGKHVAAGDLSGLRLLIHALEHGIAVPSVDPWRLLQELAERELRQA